MKLKELCRAAGIFCPASAEDVDISGIETDSRKVGSGVLFVCIEGIRTDGHAYLADAAKKGAAAILVDEKRQGEIPKGDLADAVVLAAPSPRRALAFLCDAWYGYPSRRLIFVGVTGTNGKTSVARMIRTILLCAGKPAGLIGTVGCATSKRELLSDGAGNMTTPEPKEFYRMLAEMVSDGDRYVVTEVSSHALIQERVAPLRFAVAVFTNLTPEHLDFHKTMDAYADAKAKLFACADAAVLNLDSPFAEAMRQASAGKTVGCSEQTAAADFSIGEIQCAHDGVRYRLRYGRFRRKISCPVPGSFTVMNSAQAIAAAKLLGVRVGKSAKILRSFDGVAGRMERIEKEGADVTVIIDYAHTPDALEKLLRTVRAFRKAPSRILLLFGCGGDRDREKRPLMGRVADRLADVLILTSDNSRSEDPLAILQDVRAGISEERLASDAVAVIPDREIAIRYAVASAESGDILLLAGKGHEEYEIDGNGKHPFSERKIVLDALDERMSRRDRTGIERSGRR